jgi:phage N-6-adenine-methyltransferase
LTAVEATDFDTLEQVIEKGLAGFVVVGQALQRIRDGKLYREGFATFEDYCRGRWGLSRSYAYQQIDAAKIAGSLSAVADIPAPATERVARELAPLKDDEAELVETWRELRAEHGEKVTAAKVKAAVSARLSLEQKVGTVTSSETVEWYTPAPYVEAAREVLGDIDLDPASCAQANETVRARTYYDAATDGLAQEWTGVCWMNPPYGRDCPQFIAKMAAAYDAGQVKAAIVLLSAYSLDTAWFQPMWRHLLCFVNGRISFESPLRERVNPTAGSVFVYMGADWQRFADVFERFGTVVARWTPAVEDGGSRSADGDLPGGWTLDELESLAEGGS